MENPDLQNISIEPTLQEKIDARFKQSYGSRLIEHVIGMNPENPKILERLIEDQKIIRAKYNLPPFDTLKGYGVTNYERFLKGVAEKFKVKINETSNCGSFFKENPDADGVYIAEENKIGLDIDKTNVYTYNASLQLLEHELIHAMQIQYYPLMPVELMEYEAYVSFVNLSEMSDPEMAAMFLFNCGFLDSVRYGYEEVSRKKGLEVKPKWNNPLFFLEQVDMVDKDDLEKLKEVTEI